MFRFHLFVFPLYCQGPALDFWLKEELCKIQSASEGGFTRAATAECLAAAALAEQGEILSRDFLQVSNIVTVGNKSKRGRLCEHHDL